MESTINNSGYAQHRSNAQFAAIKAIFGAPLSFSTSLQTTQQQQTNVRIWHYVGHNVWHPCWG
jgi:hypothetical protein